LRQLKRDAADDVPPARIIGLDDWSWRKTSRYGTIVVDLERRSVVDILEDRSVESVANWMRTNPSVAATVVAYTRRRFARELRRQYRSLTGFILFKIFVWRSKSR
jgi:transposase